MHKRSFHKLAAKYYGPFEVIDRVGTVAYKLQLPPNSKIHNVFHVSLLKKCVGEHGEAGSLPPIAETGNYPGTPVLILDKRLVKKQSKMGCEVLVQWSDAAKEDSTWQDVEWLQSKFPEFDV